MRYLLPLALCALLLSAGCATPPPPPVGAAGSPLFASLRLDLRRGG